MMFRYTCRLLISNFHLVWKILLYVVFSSLITIGLAYACSLPIIRVIGEAGLLQTVVDAFNGFSTSFNFYKLFYDILKVIETFFAIIATNIGTLWLYIVLFLFIIIIVRTVLSGIYQFATTNVLYNYLSSNIKFSFSSSLVNNFAKNFKYQLAYLLVELPFDVLIVAAAYFVFKWMLSLSGLILLAPIAVIFLLVFLISFRITFFSGWLPAITVFNCSVFGGLAKGVKAVFRRFYRSYSTAVLLVFAILILNVVCAICTFGASIILTMPISVLAILIYNMVVFYLSQGMRFYVDPDNVVTPKKLEETDGINKLKFVI